MLFISDKHAVNTETFNAKPRETSTQWLKIKYHFLRHWRGLTTTGEMCTLLENVERIIMIIMLNSQIGTINKPLILGFYSALLLPRGLKSCIFRCCFFIPEIRVENAQLQMQLFPQRTTAPSGAEIKPQPVIIPVLHLKHVCGDKIS